MRSAGRSRRCSPTAGPTLLPPPGSVVTLSELARAARALDGRRAGRRLDERLLRPLHAGHLASLDEAARLGDVLVVGVNSDAAVRRLKGEGRPLIPAAERAGLLAALRSVDHVLIFDEDTPEATLDACDPMIHCKGDDYRRRTASRVPERAIVEAYGGRVEFLPLLPGRSTTELVERIGET